MTAALIAIVAALAVGLGGLDGPDVRAEDRVAAAVQSEMQVRRFWSMEELVGGGEGGSSHAPTRVLRVHSLVADGIAEPARVEPTPTAEPVVAVTVAPRSIEDIVCSPQYSWPCQEALAVAWCESRYDPEAVNPSSGALGLYQLLPYYHKWRFQGGDPFDPAVNTAAAYGLWLDLGWQPWNVGGCP